MLDKQFCKMALTEITTGSSDILDRLAGCDQKLFGIIQTKLSNVIVVTDSKLLLQETADIVGRKPKAL